MFQLANGAIHTTGFAALDLYGTTRISRFNEINCSGLGISPIFGVDNRTGLTSVDASATTLYTTTAAGQLYRVTFRIFGLSGTITSAVYTISWTEGGSTYKATASISGAGDISPQTYLLQPDNGTNITGQLTTLSGTSPKVDVAAVVEQMD